MEVGLGDFVVDGNPASPPQLLKKGAEPPIFGPSIVAKRLDQDGTWQVGMEVGIGSHCVRRRRSSASERGTAVPLPRLWSMSIVATVAHLSYC